MKFLPLSLASVSKVRTILLNIQMHSTIFFHNRGLCARAFVHSYAHRAAGTAAAASQASSSSGGGGCGGFETGPYGLPLNTSLMARMRAYRSRAPDANIVEPKRVALWRCSGCTKPGVTATLFCKECNNDFCDLCDIEFHRPQVGTARTEQSAGG